MEPRLRYAPSGRVHPADLVPAASALAAGAGLTAVVLALMTSDTSDWG